MSILIDFRIVYGGGTSVTGVLWEGDIPKAGQTIMVQAENVPREVQVVEVWPAALVANKIRVAIDCRMAGVKH
jgi:hypothetical protein